MNTIQQRLRRRDRLCQILGRSLLHSTSSPTLSHSAPTHTPAKTPQNARIRSSILADTLETLDPGERETICGCLPENGVNIDEAFVSAHSHATELQRLCTSKRWTWRYNGREIVLADKMSKVMQLLDKFKSIGDVIASVDPMHIGLPWAGFRAIIQFALNDSKQRAILITGLELSLYLSSILNVYLDKYARLSPSPAARSFRVVLVELYSHILGFLAQVIQLQLKRTTTRVAQASWSVHDLSEFEGKSEALCTRAAEADRLCDNEIQETWREEMSGKIQSLDKIHHAIETGLNKLQDTANLAKLRTARDAKYDSSEEGGLPTCLSGTRVDLIDEIRDWIANPHGKPVFWLYGKAGIGKSTVSRTIAKDLDERGRLGASFFFKRGRPDRSHANLFFPTVAKQLADKFTDLGHAIASALEHDSFLSSGYMTKQFDKFLLQPMLNGVLGQSISEDCFLVIDALDECESAEQIEIILDSIKQIHNTTTARIRVLITSRPDLPLVAGFDHQFNVVRLEEAQMESIKSDLEIFFNHKLAQITLRYPPRSPYVRLTEEWVLQADVDSLVKKSYPLFIVASTLCNILSFSNNPQQKLREVLSQTDGQGLSTGLRSVYLPIFKKAIMVASGESMQDKASMFRMVVGSLVLLYDPLSATALSNLLGIQIGDISILIPPLYSVLDIAKKPDGALDPLGTIRPFHLSLRDFIVDHKLKENSESKDIWIDEACAHARLTDHCLRLLSQGVLNEDICNVKVLGTPRATILNEEIALHLPGEVAYACSYWAQHAVKSGRELKDRGSIHEFLMKHMLHWMEAMSWLGHASDIVQHLRHLLDRVDVGQGRLLATLLEDATRFVLLNRYIIDLAPLQIYMSALLFAPSSSMVRQTFGNLLERHFRTMACVPRHWTAEIQILEGHEDGVTGLVCSLDGKTIVSCGYDCSIRLWDTATGELREVFTGHEDWVSAVALSNDGQTIASVSDDETVRLWSVVLGKERAKLETAVTTEQNHDVDNDEPCIGAVAFSPDDSMLATASYNTTVRLWDLETRKVQRMLEGHTQWVRTIAFSPNGTIVATGAGDGLIKLWNVSDGKEIRTMEVKETCINVVKFSPDDQLLASGSTDGYIRFWDVETGGLTRCLDDDDDLDEDDGHYCIVEDLAFSQDGKLLASTCHDHNVSLWDVSTGKRRSIKKGHHDIVNSVVFLPDGKTMVSASDDETIRFWDLSVTEGLQETKAHNDAVSLVEFSPDAKIVASLSCMDDGIRLWGTETGAQMLKIPFFEPNATTMAFSPDGENLTLLWSQEVRGRWAISKHADTKLVCASSTLGEPHDDEQFALVKDEPDRSSAGPSTCSYQEGASRCGPRITVASPWIRYNDEDFIWLPPKYRAVSYAISGASIALGHASGFVSILSFL